MRKPIIGITMGDAAGVGPEIIVKAHLGELTQFCTPVVIGDARVLASTAKSLGVNVKLRTVDRPALAVASEGVIDVIDLGNLAPSEVLLGQVNRSCGQASVAYIHKATSLALAREIDAVTSAPTNKEAMNLAGHHYPGQTEIFAESAGTKSFHTILVGGPLRVSLVTSHCSLGQAVARCKADRVERILRELHSALSEVFRIPDPVLAVAGLNPHAGENGLLGTEEIEEIIPAIQSCRAQGMNVIGPLPSDSLFHAAEQGTFAGVVAMYHDQGTIPLKRYGYVTYAAGLPIIRTTCGHGTAFDIAGKGTANPSLFVRAAALAAELVRLKRGAVV